ncbi:hypothetical protein F4778DRAFT_784612 [Xylariomycetidae sp. FL2044]|nr:hypothetical protein F4778DRAFT_784612 [Xylariomycetidae sp. FL2044]
MDAHSLSFTSASLRETSRLYKDLKSYYHCNVKELHPGESEMMETEARAGKVANHQNQTVEQGKRWWLRSSARRAHQPGRKLRIGVVGAGVAGLRCCDILLQHGFDVTLLEGRDRLGGRVHQARMPSGRTVDAGPNWIHGTENNPILDLAKQTNTTTWSWDTPASVLDPEGEMLPQSEANSISDIWWDIIADAFIHSNKSFATINPSESLLDFIQKELAKRIPDSQPDFEAKRKTLVQMGESWGAYVGDHIRTQSLKYFWLEECIEGENLFCADTYQKVLEVIAKPALLGANIKYNTIVNKVQSSSNDGGMLNVYTTAGQVFEFDEVVMTTPLGWLKQYHQQAFKPPLPRNMTTAITSLGYGCLEKVYISFPTAFWRSANPKDRTVHGFVQILAPNYAPDSNPEKWNQEIVDLASMTPETSQPTLLFYMYGAQSRYLTDRVAELMLSSAPRRDNENEDDDEETRKNEFLYNWFRPYYARLPGYDEGSSDCQPSGCFATAWARDELAGHGSYTNFQVGLADGDAHVETLREGLPDRGLWLAGEHTAPFVALGTVTGAYWSGERVGRRIAEAYRKGVGGGPVAE